MVCKDLASHLLVVRLHTLNTYRVATCCLQKLQCVRLHLCILTVHSLLFLNFPAEVQKVYAIVAMIFGATMFGQMLSPKLCSWQSVFSWRTLEHWECGPRFLETEPRIYYRIYCSACWTGAWDRGRPDGRVGNCVVLPLLVSFCLSVSTVFGIVLALQGAHQEEAFPCAALLRRAAGKWKQGGL